MQDLSSEEDFGEYLKQLPRNDRNKGIFDKHTLDLMRHKARMDALRKYVSVKPHSTMMQDEEGQSMAFFLDSGGNVQGLLDEGGSPSEGST
jgi:hypothetical protein